MHRLEIYDKDFNALTVVHTPFIYDLSYVKELSKGGAAKFKIRVNDVRATAANLKLYNRIKIYRGDVGVFIGYIENIKADLNEIEVECQGMLKLFEKRMYGSSIISQNGGTACEGILTATNAADDTGISFGTSDITYTINKIDYSRSSVFAAWSKIAVMARGEIEINMDKEFNIYDRIGSDKSSTIIFQYISSQINTATIFDFDVELQGKDMASRIYGTRSSETVTKTDVTAQADFGLLEGRQNFSQTADSTDLNTETQNYLDLHKVEFYIPKINPNAEKIDVDSYDVGDSVRVILSNGFIEVNQIYRIIKMTVKVSENETLDIDLNLSPESINLLPSSFFEDIANMGKRVSLLEGAIT